MSWTLTKKLDIFAGPGEIKRREVVLDPQVSPEEIKSREVELSSESWTSFASVVSQQLCCGHCLCDSAPHSSRDSNCVVQVAAGGGSTASSVFRVGAAGRAFILSPPTPVPNRPPHLCGRKAKCLLSTLLRGHATSQRAHVSS